MKLNYDQAQDILMVEIDGVGVIDHAEQSGPIISHFSAEGRLILLEVLDASEFLSAVIKATMRGQEQTLPLAA